MIRRWLIAGLLVWVPLMATIWVLRLLINFLDRSLVLLPYAWRPENLLGFYIPGIGIVLSFLLILITGFFAANIIGKSVVRAGESILARIPLVRTIYSSVKRLTETVLDEQGTSFRRVFLVEWPRRELWTLAFQTGDPVGPVQKSTEQELLTIFVPTTPNPTSGFIMFAPREDVIELDMSVEDAVRMIISLGSVTPDKTDEHGRPVIDAMGLEAEEVMPKNATASGDKPR